VVVYVLHVLQSRTIKGWHNLIRKLSSSHLLSVASCEPFKLFQIVLKIILPNWSLCVHVVSSNAIDQEEESSHSPNMNIPCLRAVVNVGGMLGLTLIFRSHSGKSMFVFKFKLMIRNEYT
jgi:hypothetical protein